MKKKKKVSWSPSPPSSRRRRLFGATAILIMLVEDDAQKNRIGNYVLENYVKPKGELVITIFSFYWQV